MTRPRYLVSGVAAIAVGLAAAALGLASSVGAGGVACSEAGWAATAQGTPAGLAGGASGYYAWHNPAGWHLRLSAGAGEKLTGSVTARAPLRVVGGTAAARVGLKAASRSFTFRFAGTWRAEAIDFKAACSTRLVFKLGPQTINLSGPEPSRGAPSTGAAPTALPVLLGARGSAPATAFELARPLATGLSGQIVTGPVCPVQSAEHPCPYRPTRGTVRIESAPSARGGASGEVVATVVSDAQGRFAADLGAGRYMLTVVTDTPGFPQPKPSFASVEAGVVTDVTVLLDTGIR